VKKSTKIVAGASGTGVVLWILHAFHIIHFATKGTSPDFEVKKENAKIILTDSVTGKKRYDVAGRLYEEGGEQ
jgi:hypothetical protein